MSNILRRQDIERLHSWERQARESMGVRVERLFIGCSGEYHSSYSASMPIFTRPIRTFWMRNRPVRQISRVFPPHIPSINVDKFKEAIGTSLYPTLCSILSSASITHMSAELRCTVRVLCATDQGTHLSWILQGFSVLADSAEAHKANQKRLLQASLLGG